MNTPKINETPEIQKPPYYNYSIAMHSIVSSKNPSFRSLSDTLNPVQTHLCVSKSTVCTNFLYILTGIIETEISLNASSHGRT